MDTAGDSPVTQKRNKKIKPYGYSGYNLYRPDADHLGKRDVIVIANAILEFEETLVDKDFDIWRFWKTGGTFFAKRASWQASQLLEGTTPDVLAKRITGYYRKAK